MSTGLPAAPNGGMNLRNAASRSGGIAISVRSLSTQASDSSTPEPPAPVMMTTFSPLGVGSTGSAARVLEQVAQRLRADHARLPQHVVVDLVVAGERSGVRARGARAQARAAGLEHHHRLLLRHALRDLGERAPVLQVLAVLRDDVRVVVLLEEREQVVLVDVRLVAEADDRRDAHLRRAREADDRHADAARLRRQRRVALDVVGRAERRAQVLPRVVEAVDVGAHQADAVLAADLLDFLLALDVAGLGEARRNQHRAGDLLLAALDERGARRTWPESRTPRRRSSPGTSLTLLYAFMPMISSADGLIG